MSACLALFFAAAAPLWFFALGMSPYRRDASRLWFAPLLGCFLTGWIGELGLILSLSAGVMLAVLGMGAVIAVKGMIRRGEAAPFLAPLRDYYFLYLAVFPAVAWMVFPSMWHWTGDWTGNWRMGEAVLHRSWSFEFLARTPMNGATAVPFLFLPALPGGLLAFQVTAAALAAAALMPLVYGAALAGLRLPMRFFLILALSPLLLLHTAAMWGKLFSAGCLLAAAFEAWRGEGKGWRMGVWFWWAAGTAVHSSGLLYLPLLLVLLWRRGERRFLAHAAWAALFFLVLVVPYEAWVVARAGWAEKVANNPSVYYRQYHPEVSALRNAAEVLLSTFSGWMPWEVAKEIKSAGGGTSSTLFVALYASVVGWVSTLASSLIGIFLFFLAAAGLRGFDWRKAVPAHPGGLLAAVVLLIGAHTAVSPYPSPHGMAQNGLLPFCLLLFFGIARVAAVDGPLLSLWLGLTVLLGTLPYVAVNGGLLALFAHGGPLADSTLVRFRERIPDIDFFLRNGWRSFASVTFPVGPLLSLAAVGWLAWTNPKLGRDS